MKPTEFFKRPLSESSSGDENDEEQIRLPLKRRATVYDAVAGKVSQWGLIAPQATHSTSKPTANQPIRPDEVLFKATNAPTRYEETDYYFAHANLLEDQRLPSGDLLSALHAYIAKYYARTEENGNQKVWKCMDETALIALGVLMEETAKEVLGETGDLAFLEGDEEGLEGDEEGLEGDEEGLEAEELQDESVDVDQMGPKETVVLPNEREEEESSSLLSDDSSRESAE